ncbi:nef attachable domain protein [Chlamydia psittaci 03DC29]|nr:nef attachable domain protein [Chlamydia psittaci 01DC11]EPJ26105.1 nef attachable domain protein [Chlamydia psittaci 03DC29]EPJ26496.1 nef attachable domain protein [Chlamydia psittaci 09DC78]EPP30341.1 nef attachable domain protein [Chlamydia psittaci C1/97]EPP33151.1 nef attachable domain protein [Chlamydia psittaci C6/98]
MCSVNSSHRVTTFPSSSLSLRLFLWSLQSDIWKPIEGYGEKEISSVKNWKKAF